MGDKGDWGDMGGKVGESAGTVLGGEAMLADSVATGGSVCAEATPDTSAGIEGGV